MKIQKKHTKIYFFLTIALLAAITTILVFNNFKKVNSMDSCYEANDFNSIQVDVSTLKDVYDLAHPETMQITSYGGFCDFPLKNGNLLRIKFHGKDLIVFSIEEIKGTID